MVKPKVEPKIGDREVKVCKATGKPVIMEYVGVEHQPDSNVNGHPGWLCLHDDCSEDDARDVADFLAGNQPSTPLWTKIEREGQQ